MIKCKGGASFIPYMPQKPVKKGFKSFALCDSASAVICNFELYTGQGEVGGELAHDVVRLTDALQNQSYIVYCDNFYTSANLGNSLLAKTLIWLAQ